MMTVDGLIHLFLREKWLSVKGSSFSQSRNRMTDRDCNSSRRGVMTADHAFVFLRDQIPKTDWMERFMPPRPHLFPDPTIRHKSTDKKHNPSMGL